MCDYSLHVVPNRLAVEGERLVTHKFSTRSMGMASPADLERARPAQGRCDWWSALRSLFRQAPLPRGDVSAVCVPPGARLIVRDIPERLQHRLGVGPTEGVVFTELDASAYSYRDAVRFKNGEEVLLQVLPEGLGMDVLSIGSCEPRSEYEAAGDCRQKSGRSS